MKVLTQKEKVVERFSLFSPLLPLLPTQLCRPTRCTGVAQGGKLGPKFSFRLEEGRGQDWISFPRVFHNSTEVKPHSSLSSNLLLPLTPPPNSGSVLSADNAVSTLSILPPLGLVPAVPGLFPFPLGNGTWAPRSVNCGLLGFQGSGPPLCTRGLSREINSKQL